MDITLPETIHNRQTKLPVKARETIVRDRSDYTAEERAFSRSEQIRTLDTMWVLTKRPRPEDFCTPDGDTFRTAGDLYIRAGRDGVRRFTAYMHEGSVDHDFRYFDEVILDARNGRMAGWVRHTFKDGDEGWLYEFPNYQTTSLKEPTPAFVIIEEPSESESLVGYGTEWGYPCAEAACREQFHDEHTGSHTLDSIEKSLNNRGSYEIEINKDVTKPDSDWFVNVWLSGDCTELTPSQVADLANDLRWLGITCTTANTKGRAA
ncbi:hypothetical protein [Microbacterium sp. Leaf320]|uniref:hypothetical protein n=1 Tax=Microbacterium sp. Leaf320 TaxID=1736334 RepID=UPI0006F30A52|nr:hypothetical protein [Microbacterium sp. Leaf320]KQQ66101.1 hypothetical protein ASF63_12325 [Microbacterium sp. Leaf320]